MNITKLSTITAALSASLLLNAPSLKADDAPAATPAPSVAAAPAAAPANGGGGGGAQDFRQRMADRLKTELKITDDKEWAIIQPLIQKVTDAQRSVMMLRGGGGFGGGGFGGGGRQRGGGNGGGGNGGGAPATTGTTAPAAGGDQGAPNPNRPTPAPETTDLRTALGADGTTDDVIKAKLAALRDARKKAETNLDAAREDLKKVLTLRQEAVLVNMGLLD
jgi:hypothetical protein